MITNPKQYVNKNEEGGFKLIRPVFKGARPKNLAVIETFEEVNKFVRDQRALQYGPNGYLVPVYYVPKPNFVAVDAWIPYPEDKVFKHTKGAVIVPLSKFYGEPEGSPLDIFLMSAKRCYNNDQTREHFVHYINYFEKFYDTERELLLIYSNMKMSMDYFTNNYSRQQLITDIRRYFISGTIKSKVRRMNAENYSLELQSYKHNTNKCLEYHNKHASILMEISIFAKLLIPIITHFITVKKIVNIKEFLLEVFNEIIYSYGSTNMVMKLFVTASSNVGTSRSRDSTLWDMQHIRGRNANLHSIDSIENIMLNIMPKYRYDQNIICFNFNSIMNEIQHKVTDISYEYGFVTLSSSRRDEDNNSEFDKFESQLTKQDESKYLQNKVACQESMKIIEMKFGPFSDEEIKFQIDSLKVDGKPIINAFQLELITNLFAKYFGDTATILAINQIDYIKLMLAAKKMLSLNQMVVLPHIISGRVDRLVSKKNINKKEQLRLEASAYYPIVKNKYKNDKIEKHILGIMAQILASEFTIIDYDNEDIHGKSVPNLPDYICEEVLMYSILV